MTPYNFPIEEAIKLSGLLMKHEVGCEDHNSLVFMIKDCLSLMKGKIYPNNFITRRHGLPY